MALTKSEIESSSDVKIETISVPEWGGHVCVRTFTSDDGDEYESGIVNLQKTGEGLPKKIRALIVSIASCDESGNRLFSSDDIDMLASRAFGPMKRISDAAIKLNGLDASEDDIEKK